MYTLHKLSTDALQSCYKIIYTIDFFLMQGTPPPTPKKRKKKLGRNERLKCIREFFEERASARGT